MSKAIDLNVKERSDVGRCPIRRLRARGLMPAVVYSRGTQSRSVQLEHKDFFQLLKDSSGSNPLVNLSFDNGKPELAVVKDYQRHPLKDIFLHADFQAVKENDEIGVSIPIILSGTPIGVKNGGILEQMMHSVDVKCTPRSLPDVINIDVSDLDIGDSLHISDLPKIEDLSYQQQEDVVIVLVIETRALVSSLDAEVGEGVEGEEAEGEEAEDGEDKQEAEGTKEK